MYQGLLTRYRSFNSGRLRGTIQPWIDPLKVVLLTSAYSYNQIGHTRFADVLAFEIAAQGGYVAGGMPVTGWAVSEVGNDVFVSLNDVTILASGAGVAAWRTAVVYANVTRDTVIGPLCWRMIGNSANNGTDIALTPAGQTLKLDFAAAGVLQA